MGTGDVLASRIMPFRRFWRTATWAPWLPGLRLDRSLVRVADVFGSNRGSAMSELAGLLMSTESFEELLQGLAELSVRTVDGAVTCGITLAQDGRVLTVASVDALAMLLDEKQYEHDEGPCLQALYTGLVVDAPDLSVEHRWHGYPQVALDHGVAAVLSTPLLVHDKPVGVLNLYAATAHAFSDEGRRMAAVLAEQAAIAVTAALRHYDEVTLSDHLRAALASRSVIDQAIGIIIGQQRCTPDEAFAMLRTVSQHRNIKLRTVAADLVASTSRPVPD